MHADPLGGEQDVRGGENGPQPPSDGAEEVGRGRPPLSGRQYREVAVHLVFPNRVALQGGPASLDLPRELFPQRVHIPDDEVWDDPGLQRVPGPTVGGDHEVCASGDVLDQAWRVRRAVQEDSGPQVMWSWSAGSAAASVKAAPPRAPSAAPP